MLICPRCKTPVRACHRRDPGCTHCDGCGWCGTTAKEAPMPNKAIKDVAPGVAP